jgi:hypothetical protein
MLKLGLSIFTGVVMLSGCASLNSVSLTPIPKERNREIRSEASRTIILGFNFDNDYVDQVVNDLKSKCSNGTVSGILTKDETINYFLMLVHRRQVVATGYCKRGDGSAAKSNQKSGLRDPASGSEPSTETEKEESSL